MTVVLIMVVIYAVIAVVVGGYVWRSTAGTWSSGPLWSHVARAVVLTVACGLMWPGTLVLGLLWQFPGGRRWIITYLDGGSGRS